MEDLSGSLKKLLIESDLQLSEMKKETFSENTSTPQSEDYLEVVTGFDIDERITYFDARKISEFDPNTFSGFFLLQQAREPVTPMTRIQNTL